MSQSVVRLIMIGACRLNGSQSIERSPGAVISDAHILHSSCRISHPAVATPSSVFVVYSRYGVRRRHSVTVLGYRESFHDQLDCPGVKSPPRARPHTRPQINAGAIRGTSGHLVAAQQARASLGL